MNLFHAAPREPISLLPFDGEVIYLGPIYDLDECPIIFQDLFNGLAWKADESFVHGKHYLTKRKVAWYADQPYSYEYSGSKKVALAWNTILKSLKTKVEQESQAVFNSCLANLYHNGEEGMAWHSDAEKDLIKHGCIASLSFGAERWFHFKHKRTGETHKVLLENGSLLLMKGLTQSHWLHRLPPTIKVTAPRISLTFRQMNS